MNNKSLSIKWRRTCGTSAGKKLTIVNDDTKARIFALKMDNKYSADISNILNCPEHLKKSICLWVRWTVMAYNKVTPTSGGLSDKLKAAFKKFGDSLGLDFSVRLRAGRSVRNDAKSEPLRKLEYGREDCLCCSTGNPGGCENNSVGYMI